MLLCYSLNNVTNDKTTQVFINILQCLEHITSGRPAASWHQTENFSHINGTSSETGS